LSADNKCLGVLTSIGFYASGHELVAKNVAARIEKLPTAAGEEEGEGGVIEENILTPSRGSVCRDVAAAAVANDALRLGVSKPAAGVLEVAA
jgi:hypothetical protein